MRRSLVASVLCSMSVFACAAPHADGTSAPETSRHAVDSAAPADGLVAEAPAAAACEPGPASPPLAPRPAPPVVAPAPRRAPVSPYRVEILGEGSNQLATFHRAGRTYVLGTLGSRYRVHVSNPTGRRVEAVVSVDGLDAIDGTAADYVHKSGYVIAPYGDLTVEGFRTSMAEVATFRFSSVPESYAAREGSDRNVGVIGVAFFPERDLPPPPLPPMPRPHPISRHYPAPAPASPAPPSKTTAGAGDEPAADRSVTTKDDYESAPPAPPSAAGAPPAPRPERAGLGTEFGEERASVMQYVDFERADASHPSAVAEIRYNDRDGLIALGIPLSPPAPSEVDLRETARPFPANRFAKAPPPW